ncbi:hypothetical protein BH10ACI4_BH10ACI4_25410 [soil metagenome]
MADYNQFGSSKPTQSGDPQHCAQCEAMLTDALDGTLTPAEQTVFDLHLMNCTPCSEMVADAKRGAAWLEMLKTPRPEPSSDLLERILAQTSGVNAAQTSANTLPAKSGSGPYLVPSNTLLGRPTAGLANTYAASNVLPFRSRFGSGFNLRAVGHTLLQPRLAMTAAMAFFSVALTMNLTGVKISQLHASDLRPSSLKRSISEANAHVVRYYDNLRVVYELESRVHDLQSSSDTDTTSAPLKSAPADSDSKPAGSQPGQQNQDKPEKEARPRPKPGTSRREDPHVNLRYVVAQADTDSTQVPAAVQPALSTLALLFPSTAPRTTFNTFFKNNDCRVQEASLV